MILGVVLGDLHNLLVTCREQRMVAKEGVRQVPWVALVQEAGLPWVCTLDLVPWVQDL